MATIGRRVLACLIQYLLCLDEIAQVIVRSPIYICTGKNLPTCHETVSAWVGASAAAGHGWAIEARSLIDGIFGTGHCDRAARHEASVSTPVN